MRIDVVGMPASGKSILAARISAKLSIPHIQLDRFWFESGGRQGRLTTPNLEEVREKVRERVEHVIYQESWVTDGVYLRVQDLISTRADRIIFLDIPLWKRLLNHAGRVIHNDHKHSEVSFWDDITFFKEIVRREFSSAPELHQFIRDHASKVTVLRSRREVDDYIRTLH